MHLLQKCLLLKCVFLLCPKRSILTPLSQNIRKIYNPGLNRIVKYPLSVFLDGRIRTKEDKKLHPLNNRGKINSLSDRAMDQTYFLGESEPGFDLTDAEIEKFKIWPRGIIPYFIDDYSFDKVLRDRIRGFLDTVNTASGLNFVELPRPPNDGSSRWLFFINRRGLLDCADISIKNFSNSGVQKVLLGYNCMSSAASLAEIVLAIAGVPAQHNAPNRNEYVEVQMDNIMPDKKHLFDILKDDEWLFFDADYDFSSAGHFDFHKYTVNGAATLKPMQPVEFPVGEGDGFSFTDVWKIRMLYNYIARKKQTKAPECYKLFEPGTNFSRFQPESEDEIQPRKKLNRYLGLNEDVTEKSKEKNENEEVDQNEENGQVDGDQDNDGKKLDILKFYPPRPSKKPKNKTKNDNKGRKIDQLAHKSDYETEERK